MKKKIIVFSNYYLPGTLAGGPIRSIEGLIKKLSNLFSFELVTSSHDAFSNQNYENIKINEWNDLKYANCLYLSDKKLSFSLIRNILSSGKHDIIYLNSFFNFWYSIVPILIYRYTDLDGIKLILAPRGEFNSNALNNNRLKKSIFLFISRFLKLHKEIIWHASTVHEEEDIKVFFKEADIKVVSNISLIDHQSNIAKKNKAKNELNILFFSRITKMKNLTGALRILKNFNETINFNIYGPKEDQNYYDEVVSLINDLPKNINVNVIGPLEHEKIREAFDMHHLLLLPTLGENYGHVIRESLANNCPAIISNKTPWENFQENNIGFICNIDNDIEFVQSIKFFLRMTQNEYDKYISTMSNNVEKLFSESDVIDKSVKLFDEI